jgi:hypothetical protein
MVHILNVPICLFNSLPSIFLSSLNDMETKAGYRLSRLSRLSRVALLDCISNLNENVLVALSECALHKTVREEASINAYTAVN